MEVVKQTERIEYYSGKFVYDGRTMRKHGMSDGERLLCKAYDVNKSEITKEEVLGIRDELIEEVRKGVINEEMLYSYIEQNHGTLDAGLVSTVLCMSILPKELTKREGLEKEIQSVPELSPFRRLARAHETTFNEQYGFFAYAGEYFSDAEAHQMRFGCLNVAGRFRDNAGKEMTAQRAYEFRDNAGKEMTAQRAYEFRDNAGEKMTATQEALGFSDNAGEKMTAIQEAFYFSGNAGKEMTTQEAFYFSGNAGEKMTAEGANSFSGNAGEKMTTQKAFYFSGNAGRGMITQRAYDFSENAGKEMTTQGTYNFRDNAGRGIRFSNTKFPHLKKIGFYLGRVLRR